MHSPFNLSSNSLLIPFPSPPISLPYISSPLSPGQYVFGYDTFPFAHIPITSVFHRKYAPNAEEFVLPFLSVLLIPVISDILLTILMCRHNNPNHPIYSLETAVLVDEFYHLRNICAYPFRNHTHDASDRRHKLLRSFAILLIGLSLMAFDVLIVYLVQPYQVFSSPTQYNLRASQPVAVPSHIAQRIYNLSLSRTCVTPGTTITNQIRQFTTSACIMYNITANRDANGNISQGESDQIVVSSWFHAGGSDHEISLANHVFQIRQRAFLYVNGNGTKRLLFDTMETAQYDNTRYIHDLFLYAFIAERCNGRLGTPVRRSCREYTEELEMVQSGAIVREIEFWRSSTGAVKHNISGLSSVYRIGFDEAYSTARAAMYAFLGTAVIEEVEGKGLYSNITSEEVDGEIGGLIVEEGRITGIVLLSMILGISVCVQFAMKRVLKPASFGELAGEEIGDDFDVEADEDDRWRTCRYTDVEKDCECSGEHRRNGT